jgi:hypothetical protein
MYVLLEFSSKNVRQMIVNPMKFSSNCNNHTPAMPVQSDRRTSIDKPGYRLILTALTTNNR